MPNRDRCSSCFGSTICLSRGAPEPDHLYTPQPTDWKDSVSKGSTWCWARVKAFLLENSRMQEHGSYDSPKCFPSPAAPHLEKNKQLEPRSSNSAAKHLAEVFLEQLPRLSWVPVSLLKATLMEHHQEQNNISWNYCERRQRIHLVTDPKRQNPEEPGLLLFQIKHPI